MKHILTLLLVLNGLTIFAQEDRSEVKSYPAMASKVEFLGKIPPIRDIAPKTDFITKKPGKLFEKRNYFYGNERKNPHPQPENGDPLVKAPTAGERGGDDPEDVVIQEKIREDELRDLGLDVDRAGRVELDHHGGVRQSHLDRGRRRDP